MRMVGHCTGDVQVRGLVYNAGALTPQLEHCGREVIRVSVQCMSTVSSKAWSTVWSTVRVQYGVQYGVQHGAQYGVQYEYIPVGVR
jgi:hypothetical protein